MPSQKSKHWAYYYLNAVWKQCVDSLSTLCLDIVAWQVFVYIKLFAHYTWNSSGFNTNCGENRWYKSKRMWFSNSKICLLTTAP